MKYIIDSTGTVVEEAEEGEEGLIEVAQQKATQVQNIMSSIQPQVRMVQEHSAKETAKLAAELARFRDGKPIQKVQSPKIRSFPISEVASLRGYTEFRGKPGQGPFYRPAKWRASH